jgi:hypothetical protein
VYDKREADEGRLRHSRGIGAHKPTAVESTEGRRVNPAANIVASETG